MYKRYDHWFWNSKFIISLSKIIGRFSCWLWYMQYGRIKAKNNP